jgi:hypothetical protein
MYNLLVKDNTQIIVDKYMNVSDQDYWQKKGHSATSSEPRYTNFEGLYHHDKF